MDPFNKRKGMLVARDKNHNTARGGGGRHLLYPTFQNSVTSKRQGHLWEKTPHCHPTEINKVHRKWDRGIYKGEKITKYQNRHKRHQMTPLSGYWEGQVIKSCVLVCFSAAVTSSINKEHLKRREVHLADTSRSQCVSEESWDRNLKQKSWRNTAV